MKTHITNRVSPSFGRNRIPILRSDIITYIAYEIECVEKMQINSSVPFCTCNRVDSGPRRILRRDHSSLRRCYRRNWSGSAETRSGTGPQESNIPLDDSDSPPRAVFLVLVATNTSRHSSLIEDTPPVEKSDLVDLMR